MNESAGTPEESESGAALIRLDLAVPEAVLDPVTALLFQRVQHGWEEREETPGETLFRIHVEQPEFCQALAQELQARFPEVRAVWTEVPRRDWALAWREFFTAVPCGEDFVVIAPWMLAEQPFPGRIPIIIEPKMAFGTGHHPTTALCLELISELHRAGSIRPGMRFLDLGTGSGILGLGCAKLGLTGLGLDTDPLAIDNALENKTVNGVGEAFDVAVGSSEAVRGQTFDLIVANILAEPLIELAPELCALRGERGILILSGLLAIQREAVARAYLELGLPAPRELVSGEWAALVWGETVA